MNKTPMDRFALVLVIIGAINWLLIGLFRYDFVSAVFGGTAGIITRTIYTVVGLAGLYTISLLFRETEPVKEH